MLNIIIVDDEERIRKGLEKIIQRSPVEVNIAGSYSNGLEAYEQFVHIEPATLDILITDVRMPLMDGLKLLERLRDTLSPHTSVIILSGYDDFDYARQALKLGVVDYLLKPVDKQELYRLLDRIHAHKSNSGKSKINVAEQSGFKREIDEVIKLLQTKFNRSIELNELAEQVSLSPSYLSKLFKQETGKTITEYLIEVRIAKAKQFLEDHMELKMYEVGNLVGYPDQGYFNKLFKKTVGMTPKEYKEQKRG